MPLKPGADYFFYGTLRDDDVLALVIGGPPVGYRRLPGSLAGYHRVYRRGASYPILLPRPGARVDGIVVCGLSAAAQERLAVFEGDDYETQIRSIDLVHGGQRPARVFLPRPGVPATDAPWDYPAWRRRFKRAYLSQARRAFAAPLMPGQGRSPD